MNRKIKTIAIIVVLALLVSFAGASAQNGNASPGGGGSMGTAFTYQGRLSDDAGNPLDAVCDFRFTMWDADLDGSQIGAESLASGVTVSNGYFTTVVNDTEEFGYDAFTGDARWLEIGVRCPSGSGDYTTLTPRQALTPAPFASYALYAPWGGLMDIPAGFADGVDNDTTYTAGSGLALVGTEFSVTGAPWSGLTGVPAGFADGVDDTGSDWHLTGNSGTNPNSNFIGTTDNQVLVFKVNGQIAFRLAPVDNTVYSPNIIGGYWGNSVTAGVYDATISGGGNNNYPNRVTDDGGVVGGGRDNQAGDGIGTTSDAEFATVSGGMGNTASDFVATVGGGNGNTASSTSATVGGGYQNIAGGGSSTVPGGRRNTANGSSSFAAGHYAEAAHDGAFVWSDASTTITFTSSAVNQFLIQAVGGVGVNTNDTVANGLTVNGQVIAGGTGLPSGASEPFVSRGSASGISMDDRLSSANPRWVIYPYGHSLRFYSDGADRFNVNTQGIVYIGGLGAAGSTSLCRNGAGQIATCSSSARYKTNIVPLALGLDTILDLRPVTFDWKTNGEADLGFVAEEVAKLSPLLVTYNGDGQVEGVKYDRVSAVLVNAMQEQQQQIAALEAQNAALEMRLAALEQGTASNASPLAAPWPWLTLGAVLLGGFAIVWRGKRTANA